MTDDQAVLIVPSGDDSSKDLVRAWVASALSGLPMVPRLRVGLVVEELVSNARRHGRLPCVLRLSLDHTHRYLLVFVDDSGADDGADWTSRSGLSLVDGLTEDWAVEPRPHGKTVWADVPLGARIAGITVPSQPPPGAWHHRP